MSLKVEFNRIIKDLAARFQSPPVAEGTCPGHPSPKKRGRSSFSILKNVFPNILVRKGTVRYSFSLMLISRRSQKGAPDE